MYCIFIREHSTTSAKLLCALTLVRSMGGGPRTFPGGLNKWQWKRLHEKKAREKEKKLLAQEKQLYQARIRSQIRAKLTRQSDISPDLDSDTSSYSPLTPSDQIKALADRFMSKGAEDLWNEADGPIKSPPPRPPNQSTGTPFNLRKLFMDSIHSADSEKTMNSTKFSSVLKPRHYSIDTRNRMRSGFDFRRRGTSDRDYNLEKVVDFKAKWPRYSSYRDESLNYDEDDEDEEEEMTDRGNGKKLMSNAALGKYDVIKKRECH